MPGSRAGAVLSSGLSAANGSGAYAGAADYAALSGYAVNTDRPWRTAHAFCAAVSAVTADSSIPGRSFPNGRFGTVPLAAGFPGLPPGFLPWWQAEVTRPFQPQTALVPVAPTGLVLAALAHSAQIRALNESIFISQSAITEAEGKFDPRAFAESRLVADSDPTGNTLTTGGPDPWIDTHWYGSAGIRKQGLSGAQLEVSQQIGYEDSNSLYFTPSHQGTARLAITLTQPLLNGAGTAYNGSVMVLANINTDIARDHFSRDLQTLLFDLHRNYWDLYLQRSALAQRTRLIARRW